MGIDFNFGEHIHYNSSNFWTGVLTTFIGAALGFVFGLVIKLRSKQATRKERTY